MLAIVVAAGLLLMPAAAARNTSDVSGRVLFSGLPVPGASITLTRGDRTVSTVSAEDGAFAFARVDEGVWTLRVEMRGFATLRRDLTLPPADPPLVVTLTMLRYDEIVGAKGRETSVPLDAPPAPDDEPDAGVGILNGSVVNGGASPYAQPRAFGNNRPGTGPAYSGGASATIGNSAWNARPYSFNESRAPAPSYGDVQLEFTLGGPLRIPWLIRNGPQMFVAYRHGVAHDAAAHSARMPTVRERAGDFAESPIPLRDPLTGNAFAGNRIPADRIAPQAAALLPLYPLPGASVDRGANYVAPIVTGTTRDGVQVAATTTIDRRNTLAHAFSYQRTVVDSVNLFQFADTSRQSSLSAGVSWLRRPSLRSSVRVRYQFTRTASTLTPFFADRTNVSGDAGITGNDQSPENWGPPTLTFPDMAGLRDGAFQQSVTAAQAGGLEISLRRGRHTITAGADLRRTGYDLLSQPDPRGTLAFTGAASGHAFGDFLLGVPAASSIAFGPAPARLRNMAYDAYVSDDWRISGLTLTLGVRWEYETPYTESAGRLANLDVTPGFGAIAPVTPRDGVGPLTRTSYPSSLVRADPHGIQPRLAVSWRPVFGSSVVVRGSYGLYRNLGVYQPIALLLAQQPPFSNTFSIQNGADTPLTLASPFPTPSAGSTPNTIAVDPGFRAARVHSWQASVQRDLPGSLTAIAAYLGDKGMHLMQAFLPNTYPAGSVNPCAGCPAGFLYVASNGGSLRNAAQFTLRRRLHDGLTATAQYTLARSIDDAATFSNATIAPASLDIAQDWLDLDAERGPSAFDQRHLVTAQFQYTTGVGVAGGTLADGVRGALFKDWTIVARLSAGSGLPVTPVSFRTVTGTGFVGERPRLTGVPPQPAPRGAYANAAAYAAPLPGTWGDAGRRSIRGPRAFSLDAGVSRVFRLRGRLNLECGLTATNVLNRVTFAAIDTVITSPQFGLPTSANAMRRLHATFRLRF
jgi:hypothetical protein